jgi:hypothetical protein
MDSENIIIKIRGHDETPIPTGQYKAFLIGGNKI